MSLKSLSGGWRAFSKAKETAFGVAQTVDKSFNSSGDPMEAGPSKIWTDKDEMNGELAITRQQLLTKVFNGKHAQNLTPDIAALCLAWFFGNCTTTNPADPLQATVRKHKIVTDKSVVELMTRTLREYDGSHCLEYPGVVIPEITLTGKREEWVTLEAAFLGMGKETVITPVPTRPALVAEAYLRYGDCSIKKGGTYDGDVVSGGTDISARVQDFKLSFKNGAKLHYLFGDNTGCAGRSVRARMLDIGLEMKLDFEDRAEKDELMAGTEFILELPLVGALIGDSTTHYFTVRLVFPKVAFNKVSRGHDDGLLTLAAGFAVMAHATHGPVHAHIVNEQTQYT